MNGRSAEADMHYRTAVDLLIALGRDRSPNAVAILNNWALVSEDMGDVRQALALQERVIAAVRGDRADAAPPPYLLANRARALEYCGRYDDAQQAYASALLAAQQAQAPLVAFYARLGQVSVLLELNRTDEAAAALAQAAALAAADKLQLPASSAVASLEQLVRARLAAARGDLAAARQLFTALIGDQRVHASTVTALLGRSEAARRHGDPPLAQSDALAALDMAMTLQGGKRCSFRTGLAHLAIARAQADLGQHTAARDTARLALRQLSASVDAAHPALLAAQSFDLVQPVSA
jgi:tetratricopeptide (TPR) repeat protein